MKTVLFLRIASVLTFVHAALHTIGGVFGAPAPGAQQTTVAVMKANEFAVMGVMRSYWDFYMGFGLVVSVFLTVEAVVFWQLGSLAKTDALRLGPVLAMFLVGYLGAAVVSYRYFFVAPVITEILIAVCLGLAIASARQVAAGSVDRRAVA
jgi:predicted cobalt transporter CbtA